MTVPFVMTPRVVYMGEEGFFFTPKISRQKVACKAEGGREGGRGGKTRQGRNGA